LGGGITARIDWYMNVGVYPSNCNHTNTMTISLVVSAEVGARHLRKCAEQGKKLEVAIALGGRSMIIMAAATPIPVDLSEWLFAERGGFSVQLR